MSTQNPNTKIHFVWGAVFVAAMAIAFFFYKLSLDKAGAAADRTIEESKAAAAAATAKAEEYAAKLAGFIEDAAAKFKTGQITETFNAEIPVFQSAGVGRLEIGTVDSTETFEKIDQKKIFWDLISRGETIAEIKVPVTYRYHIDLAGEWIVSVKDDVCVVKAPPIQASLPVAIHTDKLEKKVSEGWAQFNGEELADELQRTITPTLKRHAESEKNISSIREEARSSVAKFIRSWLIREEQWGADRFVAITVLFADETTLPGEGSRPTLTFDVLP